MVWCSAADWTGERRTYLFLGHGEEPRAGVRRGAVLAPDAEVVAAREAFPARADPCAGRAWVDQAAVLEQLRHPAVAVAEVGVLQAAEVDVQALEREADRAYIVEQALLTEHAPVRVARDDDVDWLAVPVADDVEHAAAARGGACPPLAAAAVPGVHRVVERHAVVHRVGVIVRELRRVVVRDAVCLARMHAWDVGAHDVRVCDAVRRAVRRAERRAEQGGPAEEPVHGGGTRACARSTRPRATKAGVWAGAAAVQTPTRRAAAAAAAARTWPTARPRPQAPRRPVHRGAGAATFPRRRAPPTWSGTATRLAVPTRQRSSA